MKVARTIRAVRSFLAPRQGSHVLVPTMGALHEGHISLIRKARKTAGPQGTVSVSIFVNPIQFGPAEDLSRYPRPLEKDLAICRAEGVDLVFVPNPEEMYAPDRTVFVDESLLSLPLCGQSRPGHFRGVCTVVAKLFLIFQPSAAVFGEKDWQQLAVIRRMVRDLNFPIKIVPGSTVREKDGLAISSRNAYLTPAEREAAPRFNKALREACTAATPAQVLSRARKALGRVPEFRIDYVELVDAETLQPLKDRGRAGRLIAALFVGKTRLIDNVPLSKK